MVPKYRSSGLTSALRWVNAPGNRLSPGGICALRIFGTSESPALSPQDLGTERCGIRSFPGIGGNRKPKFTGCLGLGVILKILIFSILLKVVILSF